MVVKSNPKIRERKTRDLEVQTHLREMMSSMAAPHMVTKTNIFNLISNKARGITVPKKLPIEAVTIPYQQ